MQNNVKDIFKSKKQKLLVIITTLLLLFSVGLFSYAFSYDLNYLGLNTNTISTCSFNLSFKDNNPIRLTTGYPISHGKALEFDPYIFYIRSNNSNCANINYRITMKNICDSCTPTNDFCEIDEGLSCDCNNLHQLSDSVISYELKNIRTNQIYTANGINLLNNAFTLPLGTTDTYEMRMWINENATEEDLYIYNNNEIVTDENGMYLTKNYCGKLNVDAVISESNDILIPTCTIMASPNGEISNTIGKTLTINSIDTDLAIDAYSFDNITYSSINISLISSNGNYTGYVKDSNGNIGICSITITDIIS